MRNNTIALLCLLLLSFSVNGQIVDYSTAKEYSVGGIIVDGANHIDHKVITLLSGIRIGDKVQVPGDQFSTAIENIWKQGYFDDVQILINKIDENVIYLIIKVVERPRLIKYTLTGIKKSESEDLRPFINLRKGRVLTDGVIAATKQTAKEFFIERSYMNVKVTTELIKDDVKENSAVLAITIDKGSKSHIKDINFIGLQEIKKGKAYRKFKETKRRRWWNLFNSGKYVEEDYLADKKAIIAMYNEKGFRDAKIIRDSIYRIDEKHLSIDVVIDEGHKYYFRNITWVGNSKYSSKKLSRILGINKGDVFDQTRLDTRLHMNPNGADVSSLYMDNGYLFFNLNPVEIMATEDSIDFEIRIFEGKQATINKVTVVGNTKTNDHVILRELHTQPGQLFRRSDIIRSQREIAQLGYFDPEKMGVLPIPDPLSGTVDIEYTVEEKPSDQIELSGGYGGGRLVGTLGISFTNFSAKNFFKKDSWRPLPSGDGQKLSLRAQSNGAQFQSYSLSFTEPWLGGKKPQSLSFSTYYSIQSNGLPKSDVDRTSLNIFGVSVGFGQRLKKPDNYFQLYQEFNYEYYTLKDFSTFLSFSNGFSSNIYYRVSLQRNSVDKPIFETRGSKISLTGQFTLPYSLWNGKDYNSPTLSDQERYEFVEYQKYKFTTTFFTPITNKKGADGKDARNLILKSSAGFGFLAPYSTRTGEVPFERFYLGGSGLTGFTLGGREIIALRGYDDNGSVSPEGGASFISKYSMELRFPISLNPQATIFVLGFAEAGNSWNKAKDFNPFDVKRSAGIGLRLFLPMFGLLGFDYGWRLDESDYSPFVPKSQFHFTIGATLGEL